MNLRNYIIGLAYGIQCLCWLQVRFLLKLALNDSPSAVATVESTTNNSGNFSILDFSESETANLCTRMGIDISEAILNPTGRNAMFRLNTGINGKNTCVLLSSGGSYNKSDELIFPSDFSNTKYVFIEGQNNLVSKCATRTFTVQGESNPCRLIISESSLHVADIGNITVEFVLNILSEAVPQLCSETLMKMNNVLSMTDSYEPPVCDNIRSYNRIIDCPIVQKFSKTYPGEYYREISNVTACNVSCTEGCTCTLSYRTLKMDCPQEESLHVLLLYPNAAEAKSLYWASRQLSILEEEAFSDFNNLELLWLHSNKLEVILNGTFDNLVNLNALYLWNNRITSLRDGVFSQLSQLQKLYLHENYLTELNANLFKGLEQLKVLYVNNNKLKALDSKVFQELQNMYFLALDHNRIKQLPSEQFQGLSSLEILLLGNNTLDKLGDNIFCGCKSLSSVDLRYNSLKRVRKKTFEDLHQTSTVLVDSHGTCCFFEHDNSCVATDPKPPVYLTCKRLLSTNLLRVGMWMLGIAAVFGNLFVFFYRCRLGEDPSERVQFILIANLALADLMMGIYLLIITSADTYYKEYFPSYADSWRKGPLCQFAGTLSVLSSEASIFFITLISIDRLMGIKYPFSAFRPKEKVIKLLLAILWLTAVLLAFIPTIIPNIDRKIYDLSEVCIGLPLSRREIITSNVFPLQISYKAWKTVNVTVFETIGTSVGMYYSIAVFIGLNSICLLIVAYCYVCMFVSVRNTSKHSARNRNVEEEMWMTIKMSAIVFTDFLCWAPIILLCVLVQCDVVSVSPVIYTWIVTFILPINSATNPYVYTVVTLITKSWRRFNRKKLKENGNESHYSHDTRNYSLVVDTHI